MVLTIHQVTVTASLGRSPGATLFRLPVVAADAGSAGRGLRVTFSVVVIPIPTDKQTNAPSRTGAIDSKVRNYESARRYLVAQRVINGGHYGKAMLVVGIAVNVALVVTESAQFAHFAENNEKS